EGLAEREVRMETLNQSLSERTVEIGALRQALAAWEAKVSSLDAAILALHASRSWRITAPLRAATRRLRRLCYSTVGYPIALAYRTLTTCSLALLRDWRAVRAIAGSSFFDCEWYLRMNPDVAASGIDPVWHYVAFGSREGRDPSLSFSTHGYLSHNPDVAAA